MNDVDAFRNSSDGNRLVGEGIARVSPGGWGFASEENAYLRHKLTINYSYLLHTLYM
jgi:hypothetical protein